MRSVFVAAASLSTFLMTLTFQTKNANAVVYATGVVRAGCVTGGAAVVHTAAAVCRYVVVNGVRVRRCG